MPLDVPRPAQDAPLLQRHGARVRGRRAAAPREQGVPREVDQAALIEPARDGIEQADLDPGSERRMVGPNAGVDTLVQALTTIAHAVAPPSPLPLVCDVLIIAAYLGIDRNTLYEMFKRGEGPPYRRFGTKILIDRDAFLTWLRSGEPSTQRRR